MDAPRFDALVRFLISPSSRRGVLGGGAATALAMAATHLPGAVEAKKKRCRKLKQTCGGSGKKCCGSLVCQDVPGSGPPNAPDGPYCCSKPQGSCASNFDCCDFGHCFDGTCCAITDDPCDENADCCEGLVCNGQVCVSP